MPKTFRISRRNLLKASVGATAILAVGYTGYKWFDQPVILDLNIKQPLSIPPLYAGDIVDGKVFFDLTMQKGSHEFVVGKPAKTQGYNGGLLGPTLVMNKDDEVVINVTNRLGVATTTHWHGLHIPSDQDGGPYQVIEDGATWQAQFKIMNEAATFFYHPHLLDKTAEQLYSGLAGLLIVRDPKNEPKLPNEYGVDDIPLIIQDKSFNEDGSLAYEFDDIGVKGNHLLVNGLVTPVFEAPAQLVRFRLLNGSNARLFNFGFSDNRKFYQIATDGGLLEKPVALTRLVLSSAERAEIIVDFSDQQNSQVELINYADETSDLHPFWMRDALDEKASSLLTINLGAPTESATIKLPEKLTTINKLEEKQAVKTRKLELGFSFIGSNATINGLEMDMERIDQTINLGDTEIWEISNASDLLHPFHIHDIQFQILSRNGNPPSENERGWKDTVLVMSQETVRIIAKFEDFSDPKIPYMYHCHILEHEDGGMMGQFLVI
ncbi:MAG: multicopper oxidase domain-containing protein [Rhizobiales bacterium]|nr:multicopper oxidase domain-containing protein [Hyphomicrobiales bacterium]